MHHHSVLFLYPVIHRIRYSVLTARRNNTISRWLQFPNSIIARDNYSPLARLLLRHGDPTSLSRRVFLGEFESSGGFLLIFVVRNEFILVLRIGIIVFIILIVLLLFLVRIDLEIKKRRDKKSSISLSRPRTRHARAGKRTS